MIITIDGPAGAGKSTLAKAVAKKVGFKYLDTGATYRAFTYLALRNGLQFEDEESIITLIRNADLKWLDGKLILNGEDITVKIRDNNVTQNVKYMAEKGFIREELVSLQRKIASSGSWITEGRDQGSVVFPNADIKIYLDADLDERVKRRFKDLHGEVDEITLKKQISGRDESDRRRISGPLVIADGSIVIDSTTLSFEQVVNKVFKIISEKINGQV